MFQSAPPCGGRRDHQAGLRDQGVSIRAPVRGATSPTFSLRPLDKFQSAPPCGGRLHRHGGVQTGTGFNPRPRAGGDAPRSRVLVVCRCFNPRPRAGGDRVRQQLRISSCRCFNPRPRAGGGDVIDGQVTIGEVEFQSAPPCGGRRLAKDDLAALDTNVWFQSAPPCGGRRPGALAAADCSRGRFNPRPRAGGGDARPANGNRSSTRPFQSAPPCGGRRRVSAPASRRLIAPAGHPDHRTLWRRHARPLNASWRQACRTASCPLLRRSQ